MVDRHIYSRQVHSTEDVVVEAYPLGEILKTHMPPGTDLTFLSADVEGIELEILQSNDCDQYRPSYFAVEWLEPPFLKERPQATCTIFLSDKKASSSARRRQRSAFARARRHI